MASGREERKDVLQHRYRVLRRLLAANSELLELMADLEVDLALLDPGQGALREPILRLLDGSLLLSENLNLLTGGAQRSLYDAHERIERDILAFLRTCPAPGEQDLVLDLDEVGLERAREAGGKAANLGRLRALMPELVPPGLVLTTSAFRLFLEANRLRGPIQSLTRDLDLLSGRPLFAERTAAIRSLINACPLPQQAARALERAMGRLGGVERWAVRSSAVGEDGSMSFAGQFDSLLDVPRENVAKACVSVIAGLWNDRAVRYRLHAGVTDAEAPMAVLLLPMLDAARAGVLYTRDPGDVGAERMLVDSVEGTADAMVRGEQQASGVTLSREPGGAVLSGDAASLPPPLNARLAAAGLAIEAAMGGPQDIEWVQTSDGSLHVVQARPLRAVEGGVRPFHADAPVLLAGGMTIFPGRASGPVHHARDSAALASVPEGALLIVAQATPELASVLPTLAGLIAEQGNPAGHAAALVRELAVPTLFGVPSAMAALPAGRQVSLDAAGRRVYDGVVWPEIRERVRSRMRHARRARRGNVLHDRILALNLTDPMARSFRPEGCESLHDIVRFVHEAAVAAMFRLGDAVARSERRVWKLATTVPLNLWLLDLGGALPEQAANHRKVAPEEVSSQPFIALWRGMTRPGVSWAGRRQVSLAGFGSVLAASMHDAGAGVRELGAANYVLVAPDYVSVNARLAYHFAMIDALVTEVAENNFVNFRFRGGGAGPDRRDLRARFLAEVLLRSGFGVDRRGDLVTAWLRRYPTGPSLAALETLGSLLGCARQLDMLMTGSGSVEHYVQRFMAGDLAAFA